MNYKKMSIRDLYCVGELRCGNGCYHIGDKRIDVIPTDKGDMYRYEHGTEWYDTLRKAINAYGENRG